ncbi:MAG: hypothetical protein JWQ39_1498 [Glaciihabitans sp.]|nr:hypothetical protein [Glaciihabitans sp.]
MTNPAPYSSPLAAPTFGQAADGKYLARMALLIVGCIGSVAVAMVFGMIWTIGTDIPIDGIFFGIIASVLLLEVIPVFAFALSANWAFGPSPEGAKTLMRVIWGLSAGQLVCLAAVIVLAVLTAPPLWVVITIVAWGVVFGAAGILLGKRLRSKPVETEIVPLVGWVPPVPRKRDPVPFVAAGIVLFSVLLAVAVTRPWTFAQLEPIPMKIAIGGFMLILYLGLTGGMFACLARVMSTAAALKLVASRDYAQARRIRRAIFRGRVNELEPVDIDRARAIAVLSQPALRWQVAYSALLSGSLVLQQLNTGIINSFVLGYWLPIGLAGVVIAAVVVIVASRLVAVRRYLGAEAPGLDIAAM